jgi:hypothetical protein
MGDNVWNRDAIVAERLGFDCAKGHPAMGNYHHHQNPSAFSLDLSVISTVCNLYVADGLYLIDSNVHSPLIGFAYDGFPIYGAYGYKNLDGTGGIVRMKSSYQYRNISTRTQYANGTTVTAGPPVSTTYPLGYFREDYEYVVNTNTDYLDEHNGRFCITPEYPNGTYCYFATVDKNWNSAYPYVVGPTFYGSRVVAKVSNIAEPVITYLPSTGIANTIKTSIIVSPNPATEFVAVQLSGLQNEDVQLELIDLQGKIIQSDKIVQGSTITYFDVRKLYDGFYFIKVTGKNFSKIEKIKISH